MCGLKIVHSQLSIENGNAGTALLEIIKANLYPMTFFSQKKYFWRFKRVLKYLWQMTYVRSSKDFLSVKKLQFNNQ